MDDDFIPTKASQLSKKVKKPEVIVHNESRKLKKKKDDTKTNDEKDVSDSNNEKTVLDMKRTRYEIIKFGMSGFTAVRKKKAKVELAVKLGAKPPKNKYRNYKEILAMRKNQKRQKEQLLKLRELGQNIRGKSLAKNKKLRVKQKLPGILDVYGKPTIKKT